MHNLSQRRLSMPRLDVTLPHTREVADKLVEDWLGIRAAAGCSRASGMTE
jgi:hypothetical protein